MRILVLVVALCALLLLSYYLVRQVHEQTPDESAAPGTGASIDLTRRAESLAPPEARADRLWNRFTRCRRDGHVYRVAFPVGRYAHQCRHCGVVRRPMQLVTFRTERL